MEVIAALVGVGIVAASPFVPVLRPAAKAAVKGGLAVSEAVVGATVVVAKQVSDVTHRDKANVEADSVDNVAASAAEGDAAQPIEEIETSAQATGLSSLAAALRPTAETAVKAGLAFGDKAKEAVAAAGKQWSDLVSEAKESQDSADAEQIINVELQVEEEPVAEEQPEPVAEKQSEPVLEEQPAIQEVAEADDLKQIYGIGPKTAVLLENAGITTYAQLAAADEAQIRSILDAAGGRYRSINPAGWPERAQQLV